MIRHPPPRRFAITCRLRLAVAVSAGTKESVTVTVKSKVPVTEGVPWSEPWVPSDNPAGSAPPVSVQVSGGVPPWAERDRQ